MNENLNLVEILKDCPPKTSLYSVIHGDIEFFCIDRNNHNFPIKLFISNDKFYTAVTKEGKYIDNCNGECILFPSKEQRDWSKWVHPKMKKLKFDPKTLKPFDKVLVRDEYKECWCCDFFSHTRRDPQAVYKWATTKSCFRCCIPYNEDTKHLVGTTKEAPEYYRYWEE